MNFFRHIILSPGDSSCIQTHDYRTESEVSYHCPTEVQPTFNMVTLLDTQHTYQLKQAAHRKDFIYQYI
jgi:hypothetical protein